MWFIKKLDWWFLGAILALVALGLLMMISLGSTASQPFYWFYRQLIWGLAGLAILAAAALIDYRIFRNFPIIATVFYGLIALALVAVLFFGKTIRGSRSWFEFGGFNFQPVEFAKVALILILAQYFSLKSAEIWRFRHIAISAMFAAVAVGLVLLQPDWGSVLVLALLWFIMVLFSGVRTNHVILVMMFLMAAIAFAWMTALTPSQKARIETIARPALDPVIAYSQRQAVIALGSGGFLGKGLGQGTQTQLKFLPEPRTDFIFAAVAEELGFLGAFLVIAAYGLIFWRIFLLVENFQNNFSRLFGLGLLALWGSHVFINIGMNLGVFPVVGLTLPFLSYGGSSLIANFFAAGILMSMKLRTF